MANEPIYDVASFDCKNKLCSAQTALETRLLPMGGVSISKVLSYSADSFVSVSDVFTGEVRVSGRVTFKVLFLDAEGSIRAMETNVEFTDKVICDASTGGKPEILSRILDIDIINVAEGELRLAAVVEMDLYDNMSNRVKFLLSGGEEVYTREEKMDYTKLVARVNDMFILSDEIKVEGDKILLIESALITLSSNAGIDNIVTDGEIVTNIVTEAGGEVYNYRVVTPFSNESAADGARGGCYSEANAKLRAAKAALVLDEVSGAVNIEFEIEISGFVYCEDTVTPVSDAFSIVNELSLTTAEFPIIKNRQQKTVFEKVEGSVTLDNDMPAADRILACCGSKLNIANSYISDGKLVIEGTVNSAVIYYSNETGTKNSVDVELPFSITTAESMSGAVIAAHGEVCEISAKIRRGNEIDIKTDIAVNVCTVETNTARLVTDLVIGEPVEIPSAAISLHIARQKESLWDVAKALRTTPELILLQNPDLELPLKGGERVIVYRHLKKG